MRTKVHMMFLTLLAAMAVTSPAQIVPDKVMRTAVLETRLIRDASGCPAGIDLWLASTTDTIQGFEVVLQWDRPVHPEFVRGVRDPGKKPTREDSVTALLKPSDPRAQIPIERQQGLIEGWEYVEARSADGQLAKILGVAKLLGQADPSPILPGASGFLLRIPLTVPPGFRNLADSASADLNFDGAGTRLSTHRGVLFGPLTLRPVAVDLGDCGKAERSK